MAFEHGWTNGYIGLAFKDKGRTREDGVDCWGLLRIVYQDQLGIELPLLVGNYNNVNEMDEIQRIVAWQKETYWTETESPIAGDVVTLRVMNRETHMGIVVGDGTSMMHTMRNVDTCLVNLTSSGWTNRIVGYFRHSARPE